MTADIVNLRTARKRRAQAQKERKAEENRLRHGVARATRRHDEATKSLEEKRLDGMFRGRTKPQSDD